MLAAMSVEAAADGAVFHAHLAQVLLPELRRTKPDAALVMDNLAAHKTPRVRELLDHSGFAYRYLPSYSPDLNPIQTGPRGGEKRNTTQPRAARARATGGLCPGGPARRSTASPPPTPRPTFATAAMIVPTNSRFALA